MSRKQFRHEGKVVYEWEEGLNTVTIYIAAPLIPRQIKLSSVLQIVIKPQSLTVGLKGNPPYLQHQFKGVADQKESVWTIEDREKDGRQIVIEVYKAQKGVRWSGPFKGHDSCHILEEEELKKKLLLERFQEENPNFDFSQAEFNGQIPEARTYMGGIMSNMPERSSNAIYGVVDDSCYEIL